MKKPVLHGFRGKLGLRAKAFTREQPNTFRLEYAFVAFVIPVLAAVILAVGIWVSALWVEIAEVLEQPAIASPNRSLPADPPVTGSIRRLLERPEYRRP